MKKLTYAFYVILALVIFSVIVLTNGTSNNTLRIIADIILGLVGLSILIVYIGGKIIIKENNDLFGYIEREKYNELIEIVNKKIPRVLLKGRIDYLYYLKIVSLLSLNKEQEGYELIVLVKNKDNFPVLYYYKALIDFNNNNYDNLEDYLVAFKGSTRYITNQDFYNDYLKLFTALVLFKEDNKKALEKLQEASIDKFKMPCSIKAIETINSTL